jgi:hypothetical protein
MSHRMAKNFRVRRLSIPGKTKKPALLPKTCFTIRWQKTWQFSWQNNQGKPDFPADKESPQLFNHFSFFYQCFATLHFINFDQDFACWKNN